MGGGGPSVNLTPEIARVARGAAWSVAGTALVHALGLATTILTARYVAPDAYGVAGMALVVVVLVGMWRDAGLTPAIASGRLAGEPACSSAHWALTGLGAASSALVFLSAPLVAAFFRSPVVADVLRVTSPVFVLGAAAAVPQAMLQHAGRFRALAALAALNQALVTAGVLAAIALDAGLWTLVVPGVVATAVMTPAYWLTLRRRPGLVFDARCVRPFAREGLRLTASNVLGYLTRNTDNAIVGRWSGERALGLYAFAYNLLVLPLGIFSHALSPVLLPAFARVSDPERRSDALVRAAVVLQRLGAPVSVGGAATAHVLVPLVFGSRWEPAVPLVRVLMTVGALQIVGPVFGAFLLATGSSRAMLAWYGVAAPASVACFLVGARLGGPLGVALAYAFFTCGTLVAMYLVLAKGFGFPLHGLLGAELRILRDLCAMVATVVAVDWVARVGRLGELPHLASMVLGGAAVYVGAFRTLARADLELTLAVLPSRARRTGARLLGIELDLG